MNNRGIMQGTIPEERDVVDLASDDSFPASDPPSWTPVTGTGPPVRSEGRSRSDVPAARDEYSALGLAAHAADRRAEVPHPGPGRALWWQPAEGTEVTEPDTGESPTAADIERLAAETGMKLRGRLTGFRIERRGGGVVLGGTARSFYARQLALHAVLSGTRLPVVRNEIRVL